MKANILRSSALVITATILLRSLGFIRELTLASTYGAGAVADAFIIAYALPGGMLGIVTGAVSAAFIPMYFKVNGDKRIFISNVISCLAIIGLAVTALFTMFPKALVYIFASQFEPERFALTVKFVRIAIWATIPILLANILRSYLEIKEVFFLGIITTACVNLCIIPAIIFSGRWLPLMALGIVVGNVISLVLLFLLCRRHGFTYKPYINTSDTGLKEMIYILLPVLIASGISEFNLIIDRNFASSLPIGAVSSMNYAAKLSALVTTIIGTSLATVLFPQMSEMANRGDTDTIRQYLSVSIRRIVPLLLPLSIGTIVMAQPIIRILFERGSFTAEDTLRTAECLQIFALGFLINGINPLLIRAFYALGNTKLPAICSVIAVLSNIALNFLFVGPLRHRGLILATVLAGLVSAILLIFGIRKEVGTLGFASELPELLKTVLASVVMGAIVYIGLCFLPVMAVDILKCIAYTICLVIGGIIIYALLHAILRTTFYMVAVFQIKRLVG